MRLHLLVTKLTLSKSNEGRAREISNSLFYVFSVETQQKKKDVFIASGLPIFL